MRRVLKPTVLAALAVLALTAAGRADELSGEAVFQKYCFSCHTTNGMNRVGPHLRGIVGRHSAAVGSFEYSAAMKESDITWTEDVLDAYLTAPARMVPGTKMIFAGVADPAERAALIAYLKSR